MDRRGVVKDVMVDALQVPSQRLSLIHIFAVLNMTPATFAEYRVPVEKAGRYTLLLNSDSTEFGGSGYIEEKQEVRTYETMVEDGDLVLEIALPPLCGLCLLYTSRCV